MNKSKLSNSTEELKQDRRIDGTRGNAFEHNIDHQTDINLMKSDEGDETTFGLDDRLLSDDEDNPYPTSTPGSRTRNSAQRPLKQKRLDKFIDFEQELYEENDFSPLKANRSRLDSEGSDEWKDKVEALPGKANKKKRGFVSNISKKKIKDKGVKKEHSNLSDDREERFGLRRQQTYENGNFSNAITQNRISDLMQTAKFKLNSEQSTNIRSENGSESQLYFAAKESEQDAKSYENLIYGAQIILSIKVPERNELRKLTTKLRISDKCIADVMDESEYNINCLFRVLPSSQYVMQNKILSIVEEDTVPENIDVEFENFTSEVESNSTNFEISLGKSVKYEQTFQLYQDSSKRYLAFFSRNVDDIDKVYENNFSGDQCYYLGFSEYPGYNTHFKFETVANYQSEIDGYIKRDHYVYLTAFDQVKKHYLHCVKKECILTETSKTPLKFKVIREDTSENITMTVARSNVFLLSYANENFYLNVQHELNKATGEYTQKDINFCKWNDINNVDFNGWWDIDVQDNSTTALLKNFNNGKFLIYVPNNKDKPFDLTQEKDEATVFEFKSIIRDVKDINEFNEDEVFKLKLLNKNDKQQMYLCIEDSENKNLYFDGNQLDVDNMKCITKTPAEDNTYDSFKIIIPIEEKYLELSLCIDSREYIQLFIQKLEATSSFIDVLVHIKEGLSKVLIKILQFIQNQLNGKIRSDFAIGQVIPHRQDMISKVGMLDQLFKILTLIKDNTDLKRK